MSEGLGEGSMKTKGLDTTWASSTWLRVFWKWVKRGADRSYAVWMADKAEKRATRTTK